jgi:hypothetical protein
MNLPSTSPTSIITRTTTGFISVDDHWCLLFLFLLTRVFRNPCYTSSLIHSLDELCFKENHICGGTLACEQSHTLCSAGRREMSEIMLRWLHWGLSLLWTCVLAKVFFFFFSHLFLRAGHDAGGDLAMLWASNHEQHFFAGSNCPPAVR